MAETCVFKAVECKRVFDSILSGVRFDKNRSGSKKDDNGEMLKTVKAARGMKTGSRFICGFS
jgi:hypothetical protein